MTRRALLAALATVALVSACAKTDEPAEPVWGKEPCAHCAMIVGDRRYAAQLVAFGERKYFDDIGCMVVWLRDHGDKAERTWVRDVSGARWVDAKSARYMDGAQTPMDFGFETRDDGVGWDEMRDRVLARSAQKKRSAR